MTTIILDDDKWDTSYFDWFQTKLECNLNGMYVHKQDLSNKNHSQQHLNILNMKEEFLSYRFGQSILSHQHKYQLS